MEWQNWHGGECPCAGMSEVVIRFRNGAEMASDRPQREDWERLGDDSDIVAWRMGDE